MKLAVAYCRVSTDKEEQKKSISEQKAQWQEFFTETGTKPAKCGLLYKKDGTKEFIAGGIYADEGISGTSLKNRRAFNQMIEDARHKKFDMIYVEDTSRFSRSVEDGIKTVKDLRELGIGVYFRKEGWDTLTQDKDFELALRISIAQEESKVKSDRLKWAMNRLHKKGGWNGAAPYGYDVENAFLKINEDEAEIVKLIYNLYINEGYGLGKIARYLNSNQIPTKTGVQWSQTQVSSILDNKLYNGEQRQHTVESNDVTRHTQKEIPEEEHIVHKFDHLKIIDDETFSLTQLEREKRNKLFSTGTGHSNKHLLSTLIYCGHCGGTFKRKKRHTYRRKDGTSKDIGYEWTCGVNDMYGKDKCGHRNMLIEDRIYSQVKDMVKSLQAHSLDGLFNLYLKVKFNYDISPERLEELKSKQSSLMAEMKQLRKDHLDGLIDESIYKDALKDLNACTIDVKAEISRIERREQDIENAKFLYSQYVKMIRDIDIDNITNAQLKRIFKKIIVSDYIHPTLGKGSKVDYEYYCMDMTANEILEKAKELGYYVVDETMNSLKVVSF